jgi:hypothetical protein
MRTTSYTPLAPCPHGERTDRTTTDGRPLCPLCRITEARRSTIDPNTPDWRALAAGDDTYDEDELRAPVVDVDQAPDTAAILLGDLFGRDDRIASMLQRWTEREPEGMLF